MANHLRLLLIILAIITFPQSTTSVSVILSAQPQWTVLSRLSGARRQLVGDTIDVREEMMMESESARRILAGRGYISYSAMQKNNVPCNQRGQSYYDCNSRGRANPYSRGCNVITRCGGR
ncbi:rapid alkalinization factor-like [Cynara cardunculus var. scolymus]|uniref:Rapid ALkalinization Factor n=1 Tax=Cynara cardunculus var. scolymus TaxID=59895 RepID=A0A118K6C8_CYNCS|nr:rapid alkalinization factor-like [Cynara cardunculus var. scolymus]KVI10470.1 Rapid ALkalinization Factor [Cynara cardunculus var. scolymus]